MNRCYCIGCGESMRGINFNLLDKYHTIGCNHIIKDYPMVKYGVFLDDFFWKKHEKDIRNFAGIIYCDRDAVPENYRPDNLNTIETFTDVINTNTFTWMIGRLSGLTAINLAVLLKFDPIYLIGYDMYGKEYHNYNNNEEVPFVGDRRLIDKFNLFKDYNIINLNPDSLIDVFPKESLQEHLKSL